MNEEDYDRYGSMIDDCYISESQESYLRKCPFAGEVEFLSDDDSDGNNEMPVRIIEGSTSSNPGNGDAMQQKTSDPVVRENSLDLLLGLQNLSSSSRDADDTMEVEGNESIQEQIPDLNRSPINVVDSPQMGKKRKLDLTENQKGKTPIDGSSSVAGQEEKRDDPPLTDHQNLMNFLLHAKMEMEGHNNDDDNEDEADLLETVKKQGIVFTRPRWWKDDIP